MKLSGPNRRSHFTRREILKAGAATSLLSVIPKAVAGPMASDAPELRDVRVGIVAVQSCASIVIAHEKGFFKKNGLNSTIAKESSWAAARDKVLSGENHGSHIKYAQPIGSTMGLVGAPKAPMLVPFTLARNGSVFMVAAKLKGKLTNDPQTWKVYAEELKAAGQTLTIALPAPHGWHGLIYRHFLARAGINADKELKLITLPPAQMIQNLRVGNMHACAMVEPWGARGVAEKVTVIAMFGHEVWPEHPIKGFGMTEKFADQYPKTARAMLRALYEAGQWCDDLGNRAEMAKILSVPTYLNTPEATILPSMVGDFDWGDGRKLSDRSHAMFYGRNFPDAREVKWHISQFRRWGLVEGEPDYDGLAKRITRPEILLGALKDLGVAPPVQSLAPIKFTDGTVFDPTKAAEFARSFKVHNLKG